MKGDLSIQDVARATGLSAHTLRYYEQIGLLSPVGRDAGGRRRFAARDLEWIAFLQRLRAMRMPIREMCDYAALRRDGDSTIAARRALLEQHLDRVRQEVSMLEDSARVLENKIRLYDSMQEASSYLCDPGKENRNDDRKISTRPRKTARD